MRWSALKAATEKCFAPAVRGRVSIYVTRHHKPSTRGSAWLTFDGVELARACDWIFTRTQYFFTPEKIGTIGGASGHLSWGQYSAFDVKLACWSLVHEGHSPALKSEDSLRRGLAMLHRKVGRKSVLAVVKSNTASHFERALAMLRAECEGWLPGKSESTRRRNSEARV